MKETSMNNQAYVKGILKKVIAIVESSSVCAEDCLYEELAHYLTIGKVNYGPCCLVLIYNFLMCKLNVMLNCPYFPDHFINLFEFT